jgi:hypothetical protein
VLAGRLSNVKLVK